MLKEKTRRRKVRCDEQRPRCSHCERLNLECRWRPAPPMPPSVQQRRPSNHQANSSAASKGQSPTAIVHPIFQAAPVSNTSPGDVVSTPGDQQWLQNPGAVDQLFDYASFMWDVSGGDGFANFSPERAQTNFGSAGSDPWIVRQTWSLFTSFSRCQANTKGRIRGKAS